MRRRMSLRMSAVPIVRGGNMVRRLALAGFAAAALATSAAFAPPALAGNVAWSVTLGAPGIAVGVGAPGYGWGGPYYRPVAPVPYAVAPPVVYPYAAPYVAVARPYHYPYYRPYVYGRPVHYAHGYYGWH
jgi:hypothetical protein